MAKSRYCELCAGSPCMACRVLLPRAEPTPCRSLSWAQVEMGLELSSVLSGQVDKVPRLVWNEAWMGGWMGAWMGPGLLHQVG